MLTIIYGGFGSGKSTELFSRIKKSISERDPYKKSIYLIVPEQDTVRAEAEASSTLAPSAALVFEVLNFSRLANTVFRSLGGLSYNYADKTSKALCMWQSMSSLGGMLYEESADGDEGRISKTMAVLNELRASGVSVFDIEAAAKKLGDTPLGRELSDLSLILSVYEASLADKYADSEKDIDRVCSLLETNKFFSDTDIYIDGFVSFTAPQLKLIGRLLSQSKSVTITLPLDFSAGEFSYGAELVNTKNKLELLAESLGDKVEYVYAGKSKKGKLDALRYLSDNLYLDSAPVYDGDCEGIEIYETADIKEEAEAVSALIKKKITEGARYRDIAVIARNTDIYEGVLERAFERHGIPCFFARDKRAEAHPAIKFIYSALSLYTRGARREDVVGFIKTGYTDITGDECNLFEKYVNSWKINGKRFFDGRDFENSPGGYTDRKSEKFDRMLECANKVKHTLTELLLPFFDEISGERTLGEHCHALWRFLDRLGIKEKLEAEAQRYSREGDEQSARECEGVYSCIISSLDTMVKTVGEECVSAHTFYKLLRLTLHTKKVSVIPTSADAVTVGDAVMLRADRVKHAIIIGASDGAFPLAVRDKVYFDYVKRKQLSDIGIDIEHDVELDASKELFYYARAVSAPSESLSVIYSKSGSVGRMSNSTVSLMRLMNIKEVKVYSALSIEDRVYDRAGAYEAALSADFENDTENAGIAALALISKEWEKEPYQLGKVLSRETAKALFSKKLSMTQSRLESYARCHFAYFCRYILALDEDRQYDFSASDIGNLVHNILDELTGKLSRDGEFRFDSPDEDIEAKTAEIIENYILRVCPEGDARSARLLSLFGRLRRSVGIICKNICHEFCESNFTPIAHEMKILDNSPTNPAPLTFTLSEGAQLSLYGILDRADAYRVYDDIYVRVVDYKTGAKDFSLRDVERGLNLQLLIYLFCMCAQTNKEFIRHIGGREGSRILPAGMLYYSASVADVNLSSPKSELEIAQTAERSLTRRGLLANNESVLRGMEPSLTGKYIPVRKYDKEMKAGKGITLFDDKEFEELKEKVSRVVVSMADELCTGDVEAKPSDYLGSRMCETCSFRAVCRNYSQADEPQENSEEEG